MIENAQIQNFTPMKKVTFPLLVLLGALQSFALQAETILDKLIGDASSDHKFAFYQHDTLERDWQPLEKLLRDAEDLAAGTMIEVTAYADSEPTEEQKQAAQQLYEQTLQAAIDNGWFHYENALEDGYFIHENLDHIHHINLEYVNNDEILNPEKPEFLMFYDTPEGKLLAGAMFVMNDQFAHGPQPGGNLTVWHYHIQPNTCWNDRVAVGTTCDALHQLSQNHPPQHAGDLADAFSEEIECEQGTLYHRSPEMLHVWFIEDHPQGLFATNMGVPVEFVVNDPTILEQTKISRKKAGVAD